MPARSGDLCSFVHFGGGEINTIGVMEHKRADACSRSIIMPSVRWTPISSGRISFQITLLIIHARAGSVAEAVALALGSAK